MSYNTLSDTGWKYTEHADPRRGWHDYCRVIKVDKPLTKEDIDALVVKLSNDVHCPAGQGAVTYLPSKSSLTELYFSCYTDSSD